MGLALDFSKCYDRVPLEVLREVAQRAGVPRRVAEPMIACYVHERRVRADGLAGPAQEPVRGLVPGCPAETHWLALVAHCWAGPVRAAGGDPRDYVDDLVAVCSGRDRLVSLGAVWDAPAGRPQTRRPGGRHGRAPSAVWRIGGRGS